MVTDNLEIIIFVLSGVILMILIWLIFLQIQHQRLRKTFSGLLSGVKGENLEKMLIGYTKDVSANKEDIQRINRVCRKLDNMAQNSVQKIGVVRFNPFQEVGGDQSFSVAFLDAKNNGIIISSLFSREGTRIYTKSINKGKSSHHLTEEENEAINKALTK